MVTIFTPVFNRKYIIHKLYGSLKRQTCKEFEWIVIDDGSTDDIYELLQQWKTEEKGFPIIVERVVNGGKHRAINRGVKLASGEAFFIVDSDDYIADDAVELIKKWWDSICDNACFAGIAGLKAYHDQNVVGEKPMFDDFVDATNLERAQYGLLGDKAEVYRTSVLKKYPFPEYENENFVTEEVVWNRIAYEGLKIRWYNRAIYYCEYLEDGLTKRGKALFERNPKGWARHIHDSNVYGYWDRDKVMAAAFDFFETNYDRLNKEQIQEMLGLSSEEIMALEKKFFYISDQIKNLLEEQHCKTVAVYGVGNYGKRVLRYLKRIGVDILYLIDQKLETYDGYTIHRLHDTFETVDCVCIALKKLPYDLKEKICDKFPQSYVWALSEEIDQF